MARDSDVQGKLTLLQMNQIFTVKAADLSQKYN